MTTVWPTIWKPMLASNPAPGVTVEKLAADDGCSFERKFDGVRVILSWDGTRVRMFTRTSKDIAAQFPEIVGEIHGEARVVLDGELLLYGQTLGGLSLRHLIGRVNSRPPRVGMPVKDAAYFNAFDILRSGDLDVTALPLHERREILAEALGMLGTGYVCLVEPFTDKLLQYEQGRAAGHEGVVAKRLAGSYRMGRRSPDWVKLKHRYTLTAIVYGVTETDSSARPFGAALLAMLDHGKPVPVGQVGSGLSDREMTAVRAALGSGTFPLVEVTCMGRVGTGLREPVFVRVLPEAEYDDARISQLDEIPLH